VKVEITKDGTTVGQKRAAIKGMTDVRMNELGRDQEYIFCAIDEIDTENWGRKGQSLADLRKYSQQWPSSD